MHFKRTQSCDLSRQQSYIDGSKQGTVRLYNNNSDNVSLCMNLFVLHSVMRNHLHNHSLELCTAMYKTVQKLTGQFLWTIRYFFLVKKKRESFIVRPPILFFPASFLNFALTLVDSLSSSSFHELQRIQQVTSPSPSPSSVQPYVKYITDSQSN